MRELARVTLPVDELADHIVVLDHGRVAAAGSPAALKAQIGGERVVLTVASETQLERAAPSGLAPFAEGPADCDDERLAVTAPIRRGTRMIDVVRALDSAGVEAIDVQRREPTLDDVFLTLTRIEPPTRLEMAA